MRLKSIIVIGLFSLVATQALANNHQSTEALCKEIIRVPVNFSIVKALIYEGANLNCQCEVKRKTYYVTKDIIRTTYYSPNVATNHILASNQQNYVETTYVTPMQVAVTRKDYALMRFLVSIGYDLNQYGYDGLLPLESAYRNNDYELMDMLIRLGADVKSVLLGCPQNLQTAKYLIRRGADAGTLRIDCAINDVNRVRQILALHPKLSDKPLGNYSYNELINKPKILNMLLQNGFPNNGFNNPHEQKTLLMLAARKGKTETVQLLLDKHVNPNQKDAKGYTALFYAIQGGNEQIIKSLLEQGARTNIIAKNGKDTPMLLAVNDDKINVVRELLKYNSTSEEAVGIENEPLIVAFEQNKIAIAKLLIEHGDNPDKIVQHFGAEYLYQETTRLENALKLGVSPNIELQDKPLLNQAIADGNEEVVAMMFDYNVDPNLTDKTGKTPLHDALDKKDYELAEQIIRAGADLNIITTTDAPYLHRVIESDNYILLNALLQKNANANIINTEGETPLEIAAKYNNIEFVRALLKHWARPNCQSLYNAITIENLEMVKLLVKYGADTSCKTDDNQSLVHFARTNNRSYHIERFLKGVMSN